MNGTLSRTQVCRLLDLSYKTIEKRTLSREIPASIDASGRYKYAASDIVKHLRDRGADVPPALLALADPNPLAGFSIEQLEEELAARGRDYRSALEALAVGTLPAGPWREGRVGLVTDGVREFAQRLLTGAALKRAS
jgi:hypothetical protein